jgi:YesN/AraC family two-component response regulator
VDVQVEGAMPPIHVLIVDDDHFQRALIRILVLHSFPTAIVAEAQDGQDALVCYEAEGADLIITDIQMPILDGIALTTALRARNGVIPIIVVSGVSDGESLACDAGASRYLSKAVMAAQLPQVLADVLAA